MLSAGAAHLVDDVGVVLQPDLRRAAVEAGADDQHGRLRHVRRVDHLVEVGVRPHRRHGRVDVRCRVGHMLVVTQGRAHMGVYWA